ncbi:MAG: hypothetical protein Q9191_005325 [Dirinaria sp. TL-2023a]
MADQESYMLPRDSTESERLDSQHEYMRDLGYGHLIHPSINTANIRAIADIGTGTGIWLRETAQQLAGSRSNDGTIEFVGFDISSQQFPKQNLPNLELVVHDIVTPFPHEYQERFDLVHVRLLTYALKVEDLESAVKNAVNLIRPGGFLQWEESDAIDVWATPETARTRATVDLVCSERIARGLSPAFVLFSDGKEGVQLTTLKHSDAVEGKFNPLTWTEDMIRILHLETISSMNHEAPRVQAMKTDTVMLSALALLNAALSRRAAGVAAPAMSISEVRRLESEAAEIKEIIEAIKKSEDPASSTWDMEMTRILARKVAVADRKGAWMSLRR